MKLFYSNTCYLFIDYQLVIKVFDKLICKVNFLAFFLLYLHYIFKLEFKTVMRLAYKRDRYNNTQAMVGQEIYTDPYSYIATVIRMFTVMCGKYYNQDDINFLVSTYINISEGRKALLDEDSLLIYRKRNGINIRSVKYRLKKHIEDYIIKMDESTGNYSLHEFIMDSVNKRETRFEMYLEFVND